MSDLNIVFQIGFGIMTGALIASQAIKIEKGIKESYPFGVILGIFTIGVSIFTVILFLMAEITF